jgi:Putative Ig domain
MQINNTIKNLMLCLFFVLSITFSTEASHFRYGTISWRKDVTYVSTTHRKIIFTVNSTWRHSFPWTSGASPAVGATINSGHAFNITSLVGSSVFMPLDINMNLLVTSINSADDYANTQFIYEAILPIGGFPFLASFENCCRLSNLSNNADKNYRVETRVSENNIKSPIATLPPIIYLLSNTFTATVPITSLAFDNNINTYRLATAAEMGGTGLTQAPGLSIVGSNLVMNTVGKAVGSIWNGAVIIEPVNSSGIQTGTRIAVDVLFQITGPSTPPLFVYGPSGPTPANSTEFNVRPLNPINFSVRATDVDPGDIVSLTIASPPAGSTFSTTSANPVNGTFSWTPTATQIGNYILLITARDSDNVTSSTTIFINVSEEPEFISPTLGNGSIACAIPGETINTSFNAKDLNVNNTVSLSALSGIIPGMSFSPALPTASSNPVSTNFSWTPQHTDWGAKVLTMKATNQLGNFKNSSVTWVVDTRPTITSTPESTNLIVGQLFTYTMVAADADIPQGDHIDIESSVLPSFLSIVDNGDNTFTLSGTPTLADLGSHNVDIELQDEMNHYGDTHCGNVHQTFILNVIPCQNNSTKASGPWNDSSTWTCGYPPLTTEIVIINSTHLVSVPLGIWEIKGLIVKGDLKLANGAELRIIE